MKKCKFLIVLLFISVFVGCNQPTDKMSAQQKLLIGTWKPAPNTLGEDVDIVITFKPDVYIMTITITDNEGKKTISQGIATYTTDNTHIYATIKAFTLDGVLQENLLDNFPKTQVFGYKLLGDTLSISVDGKTIIYIRQ